MSGSLKHIYAPLPSTTRGKPTVLSGDPKGNNFLYTCGNSVIIRNIKNPLVCDIYYEHAAQTTVAKYAPSGFYIASGDVSGTLRIWDTTQLEHILKIELKVLSGPILDIAWSPDSQRIIVVGDGKERFGAAMLWDSGASVGEITGHSKAIISCDFKPTRPFRVATGAEDFQVNWFEGPPFKFIKAFKEHSRFVNCVRFSPDGNKLVTVGADKKVFVFDGKTFEKQLDFAADHGAGIYACSWSPDSKQVLTVSADKTAKIWDASTGQPVKTFTFGENLGIEFQQLGCLWQGEHLLTVNLNGDLTYLDVQNPQAPLKVLKGHNKFITALAFDQDKKRIYSGSYDAAIIQWDVDTGATQSMSGQGHTNSITAMQVQGDNLVTISMDDSVRISPLGSRQYGAAIALDSNPTGVSAGKKDTVVVSTIKSLYVMRGGQVAHTQTVNYQPSAIALSPDESLVAVGGKDNSLHIYSLTGSSLTETKAITGNHRGALTAITYSPDGKWLASADANRDIFVWDVAAGHSLKIQGWVFHTARVTALAWASDSLHLASGSLDNNLYVWSVEDPSKRINIKNAHPGGVTSCVWTDNTTLASAGQDCSVKSWSIKFH